MIVKVCGMREAANVEAVGSLGVEFIGFILFDRSPRYVADPAPDTAEEVKRVGVFVNASEAQIAQEVARHRLDFVQLHGSESVELCAALRNRGLGVIKAVSIATPEDMAQAAQYEGVTDYLLFDTKCVEYGGSGRRFDWSLLDGYNGSTPFLLSGGIDEDSAAEVGTIHHKMFAGVDLNSRFEVRPAVKDITKLKMFLTRLKNEIEEID
ncbi:MAG: phosphoribosylanthranilate isomerase [Rikenellaceae bacterium]